MSPRAKVDLDQVAEKCFTLTLTHVAETLPELLEQASRDDLPRPVSRARPVAGDRAEDERRIATSLKLSGLPTGKTLEGFDWTFQPRIDRGKLETLSTCVFIRAWENVLFLGPPGVGNSHLAVALGVKAIKNGFSTTHFVLEDLMHALKSDAAVPPARLNAKRYLNSPAHHRRGRLPAAGSARGHLFFRQVSARYERGSIRAHLQQAREGLARDLRRR
jgi:DNA replication protein DnaC